MARLQEPKITGTYHNVTVYRMRGTLYMRSKSNLTSERVKTDPAFQPTMAYAAILAMAAPIASNVYQTLRPKQKKSFSYQFLTGKAINLLKSGLRESDVLDILHELYGNSRRSFINTGRVQTAVGTSGNTAFADSQISIGSIYTKKYAGIIASSGSPGG